MASRDFREASSVRPADDVQIRVEDGSVRIRSPRQALRYVGEERSTLADDEGFVDTGDAVERRRDALLLPRSAERRRQRRRSEGLPEEVEAAISRAAVRMSMVRSSRSRSPGHSSPRCRPDEEPGAGDGVDFKREILQICRPPRPVGAGDDPFVSALGIAAAASGPSCVR